MFYSDVPKSDIGSYSLSAVENNSLVVGSRIISNGKTRTEVAKVVDLVDLWDRGVGRRLKSLTYLLNVD